MDWILWFGYTPKQKGTGALFKTVEAGHIHSIDVRWYSNLANEANYLQEIDCLTLNCFGKET